MRLRAATYRPSIAHNKSLRAFPPPALQFRFVRHSTLELGLWSGGRTNRAGRLLFKVKMTPFWEGVSEESTVFFLIKLNKIHGYNWFFLLKMLTLNVWYSRMCKNSTPKILALFLLLPYFSPRHSSLWVACIPSKIVFLCKLMVWGGGGGWRRFRRRALGPVALLLYTMSMIWKLGRVLNQWASVLIKHI